MKTPSFCGVLLETALSLALTKILLLSVSIGKYKQNSLTKTGKSDAQSDSIQRRCVLTGASVPAFWGFHPQNCWSFVILWAYATEEPLGSYVFLAVSKAETSRKYYQRNNSQHCSQVERRTLSKSCLGQYTAFTEYQLMTRFMVSNRILLHNYTFSTCSAIDSDVSKWGVRNETLIRVTM